LEKGKMGGFGKITWPDGSSYEGNWQNGMFHGNGQLITASKDKIIGTWVNDLLQGPS